MVKSLLAEPRCTTIMLINRRKLDIYDNEPRVTQHIVDMDKLATEAVPLLQNAKVSACFCTMGVGRPSKVTREEFERVDLEIPTAFAKASKDAGCVKHISLLSSVGANADLKPSRFGGATAGGGLYLGTKGKVEKNFEGVGLESAAFFRPSTLVGNANTPGWAPFATKLISWILPKKYKEIHINALGGAMVNAAVLSLDKEGPATAKYEGTSLFELVRQ